MGAIGAAVVVRPFEPHDAPRLKEISDLVFPGRRGLGLGRFNDAEAPGATGHTGRTEHNRVRLVAESPAGVLGWGQINRQGGTAHPGRYGLNVMVDPAFQRRGVGGVLYDHLLRELRARDARVIRATASESKPHSIAFLAQRGFVEVDRLWESCLDVAAFDFAPFSDPAARLASEGIAVTTLASELARSDREAVLRRVYDLEVETYADVPVAGGIPPRTYEEFLPHGPEAPKILLDAWFLAKAGTDYVGESCVFQHDEPDALRQRFTGVRRDYRGTGIALVLKLATVRYAREHGKREIWTGNHGRNHPMLRVNETLGFERRPAHITFEKRLED